MSAPDGGPAFPAKFVKHQPGEVGNQVAIFEDGSGMSLRDYFAAKVLPNVVEKFRYDISMPEHCEELARNSYRIADAMIAERAK